MTLPGGEMSGRPLHFFFIADCSSSMSGSKIQTLNAAIREVEPEMRKVANSNPHAKVLVRAIKFSSGASWHVTQPTPIKQFHWPELTAGGVTDMGKALQMVANELKMPPMDQRGLPPVLILLSDGYPTDDAATGIKAIMDEPWGRKAVRIAIGIGENDGDINYSILERFIGNSEIQPLRAHNADQLINFIRWASTVVLQSASSPAIIDDSTVSKANSGLYIPAPTSLDNTQVSGDIW